LTLEAERLHGFFPLLQQGFMVRARVGCSIKTVLCEQFGLSPEYLEDRIKTIFLDGKPVDNVDSAIVKDGSTLALSAAMPGLVGAALRRGGSLALLRRQITHPEEKRAVSLREGTVVLKLFNLLLSELGPRFLKEGICLRRDDLKRFFMSLPREFWAGCRAIRLDGEEVVLDQLLAMELLNNHNFVKLQVDCHVQ